jgi:hypothetical protein
MTINDFIENFQALTMDSLDVPQVQIVEVSVPKIPNWFRFALVAVVISLVVIGVSYYTKLAENRKRLAEIERLRLINAKIAASKVAAEEKLDYYGLKE